MAKKYSKRDVIRILKNEIETPKIVTTQVNQALQEIGAGNGKNYHKRRSLRWQAAVMVIGVMMLGTVTVRAAEYFLWNQDVVERFDIDEAQQQELERQKVTVPVTASATDNGVTISLEQSLMTDKYIFMYFKITAPEDVRLPETTSFGNWHIMIAGADNSQNFCIGPEIKGDDETDSVGNGEGNVIYREFFMQRGNREDANGKELMAHFQNLISDDGKGNPEYTIAEGEWDLSWKLDYTSSESVFEVNQPLGHSGILVKQIILSPISIEVVYDWPRKKTKYYDDGSGEMSAWKLPAVSPVQYRMEDGSLAVFPVQYRMKDGSLKDISNNSMRSEGYKEPTGDDTTYVVSEGCNKVHRVDDIQGVVFLDRVTEERYEVHLK